MNPRFLSSTVVAVCLHESLQTASYLLQTFNPSHDIGTFDSFKLTPSSRATLGSLADYKHGRLVPQRQVGWTGPDELPHHYRFTSAPPGADGKDDQLNDIAVNLAHMIQFKNPVKDSEELGRHLEEYKQLEPRKQQLVKNWIETSVLPTVKDKSEARRMLLFIDQNTNYKWMADHMAPPGRVVEDNGYFRRIELRKTLRDTLRLDKPNYNMKEQEIKGIIPRLYEIFSAGHGNGNKKPEALDVKELWRVKDTKGPSTYKKRIANITCYLWKSYPGQNEPDQKKTLRMLYMMMGDSPSKADTHSRNAWVALKKDEQMLKAEAKPNEIQSILKNLANPAGH